MHYAAFKGQTATVAYLMTACPNLITQVTADQNKTALYIAMQCRHIDTVQCLLGSGECVQLKLAAHDGSIPLHFAAQHGYIEMARLMVARGKFDCNNNNNNNKQRMERVALRCVQWSPEHC